MLDPRLSIPSIRGRIITPTDTDYEAARRVFNGLIDRRPRAIVRPVNDRDVALAIEHARRHSMPLAIRGGGHSVAGHSVVDDGLVIDNSALRHVAVDVEGRVADVQAGATWRDFDAATQPHGLAMTGGLISTTGVAGFTLGGGIGWLVREHGLACDNLIAADVVTAEGRLATAGEGGDHELLWALRGGGGNFGVVTRFRFRLHRVGPRVLGGLLAFPRTAACEVLRSWRDFIRSAPNSVTSIAALMTAPDGQPVVGIGLCHVGPAREAAEAAATVRAFGRPFADHVGEMPYVALQRVLDATAPYGARNYWKSGFMSDLTDQGIDAIVEAAGAAHSALSQIHIHHLGGAMSREPSGGSAFANRGAAFVYNVVGTWTEAAEDAGNIEWAKRAFDVLQPHSTGAAYMNFLGADGAIRDDAVFGSSLARLRELKHRLDPENLFRQNQNVAPY